MRARTVALVVTLVAAACRSDPDSEDPVEAAAPPEPTAAPTTVDDEPDADATTAVGGTAHIAYWHLDTGEVAYATPAG